MLIKNSLLGRRLHIVGIIKKALTVGKNPTATPEQEIIGYQDHSLYGSIYRRENQYSAVTSKRISEVCMGL